MKIKCIYFSILSTTNLEEQSTQIPKVNILLTSFNMLVSLHKFQMFFLTGSTFLYTSGKKRGNFGNIIKTTAHNNKGAAILKFLLISHFIYYSGNLTSRIVWTLLIEVIVFVITIILAMVDTSESEGIFFYITIGSVILLNSKKITVRKLIKLSRRALYRLITRYTLRSVPLICF